jgi:hypothetical protein
MSGLPPERRGRGCPRVWRTGRRRERASAASWFQATRMSRRARQSRLSRCLESRACREEHIGGPRRRMAVTSVGRAVSRSALSHSGPVWARYSFTSGFRRAAPAVDQDELDPPEGIRRLHSRRAPCRLQARRPRIRWSQLLPEQGGTVATTRRPALRGAWAAQILTSKGFAQLMTNEGLRSAHPRSS